MGGITRHQEYPYQYKSISLRSARDCGYGSTVSFNLPTGFIEAKNLYAHVRIQFDASEPTANRKIIGIGQPTWPLDGAQEKMLALNLTADGNRRIDLEADLTQLIPLLDIFDPSASFEGQGYFNIGILHPNVLSTLATIELWKIEDRKSVV